MSAIFFEHNKFESTLTILLFLKITSIAEKCKFELQNSIDFFDFSFLQRQFQKFLKNLEIPHCVQQREHWGALQAAMPHCVCRHWSKLLTYSSFLLQQARSGKGTFVPGVDRQLNIAVVDNRNTCALIEDELNNCNAG